MDSSEYELMKKRAQELQDSLAREKELSEQISNLKQEKFDTLKQAEKQVVVRTITEVRELQLIRDVEGLEPIVRNILSHLAHNYSMQRVPVDYYKLFMTKLGEALQEKAVTNKSETEEQKLVGLSEVKELIREDVEKSIQEELVSLRKKELEYDKLQRQCSSLQLTENRLLSTIEEQVNRLNKFEIYKKEMEKSLDDLQLVLVSTKNSGTIFNWKQTVLKMVALFSSTKDKIKDLWDK